MKEDQLDFRPDLFYVKVPESGGGECLHSLVGPEAFVGVGEGMLHQHTQEKRGGDERGVE